MIVQIIDLGATTASDSIVLFVVFRLFDDSITADLGLTECGQAGSLRGIALPWIIHVKMDQNRL